MHKKISFLCSNKYKWRTFSVFEPQLTTEDCDMYTDAKQHVRPKKLRILKYPDYFSWFCKLCF